MITDKKLGILYIIAGMIGIASWLVGGKASQWGLLICGVGTIVGGILQMRLERKK